MENRRAAEIHQQAKDLLAAAPTSTLVDIWNLAYDGVQPGDQTGHRLAAQVRGWILDALDVRGHTHLLAIELGLCTECWTPLDSDLCPFGC